MIRRLLFCEHSQHRVFERPQFDFDLRDAPAEFGVLDQGAAITHLVLRHFTRLVELAPGSINERAAGAFVLEQEFGVFPALAGFANQVFGGNFHIVEKDLVEVMLAIDRDNGPDGDARRLQVSQQERDALLRLDLGIGSNQKETPVGLMSAAGPDLGAIHDIAAVFQDRSGLERGQIRTGIGLRESLRPDHVAFQNRRQEALLLFLVAEGDDGGTDQIEGLECRGRRIGLVALVLEQVALQRRPARPTVLLRPMRRRPALLMQGAYPRDDGFAVQAVGAGIHKAFQLVGQIGADELPHFQAECFIVA